MPVPRWFAPWLFVVALAAPSAVRAAVFIGPEIPVGVDSATISQHAPDVSDLGAVIWREDLGAMSLIRTATFSPAGQQADSILSSNAFSGSRPSISAGGLGNVFVWEELSPLGGAIHDLVISGDSSDSSPSFAAIPLIRNLSAGLSAKPFLACERSNCLVFSDAGTFLHTREETSTSVPFPAGTTGSATWTGSRFLAAYNVQDQTPCVGICFRTFSLRLAEVDSSGPHDLVVDGSLGSSTPQSRPSIAVNGSLAVLATIDGGDAWFVPVDLPGSAGHSPIALDERQDWTTDSIDMAFSGNRFLVVWSSTVAGGTSQDIRAAFIDPSGRSIETGPFLITSEGSSPSVASLGDGHFAVVYEKEIGTAFAPRSRVIFRTVNIQPRGRSIRR